jgi:asparagine synthase (glutamine-hydrolysing)
MIRLAGFISDLPSEQASARLAAMLECMLHERFYTYRVHAIPELGCYLGLVTAGEPTKNGQFVVDSMHGRVVAFAGEHFGTDPAETAVDVLARYDREGERCLLDLNGWFAGAVVDVRAKTVVLFNDRFGLHRLYYGTTPTSFSFASEAKSILATQPEACRLDPTALGQFLSTGCVMDDLTLFRDVCVVPAGSAWTIDKGRNIRKTRYFTPEHLESLSRLSEDEFSDRLRAMFTRVIPRYFRDPEQTAVSLTGGLDTRALMAFGDHAHGRHAYTYGGIYRDCFDVRVARKVARACGYQHQVLPLSAEFLTGFPDLAAKTVWTTDGTSDINGTHEIYLSRLARQIAPVRLTGNYGSEVLRSQSTFKPLGLLPEIFDNEFLPFIQAGEQALQDKRGGDLVSWALFKEIPWSLYGRLAAAQSQLTVRAPFTDNELVPLAYQGPRDRPTQTRLWLRAIATHSRSLSSIPTDMGVSPLGHRLRTFPDRMLKYALFKAEWYYEGGAPHWFAAIDRGLSPRGPLPPFVGLHKIENYRRWLRDELFDWVRSTLCDSNSTRACFDRRAVARLVDAHGAGKGNYLPELNKLLTVELIHRLFVDRRVPNASIQMELARR